MLCGRWNPSGMWHVRFLSRLVRYAYWWLMGLLLYSPEWGFATHLMGGEISYQWVGGNNYLVTIRVYRDCAGIPLPLAFTLRVESQACGIVFTTSAPRIQLTEVSQVCPQRLPQTRCNGGSLPGVQMGVYQTTVSLPATCPDWVFSISSCCRNNAITNLSSSGSFFTYSTLNNQAVPSNNSVQFMGAFMPYVCANMPITYDLGPVDPDADSLVIFFDDVLQGTTYSNATPIPFVPGLSKDSPLRSYIPITLDSFTGTMCFNPYPNQFAVVGFRVQEYRNNQLIAEVHREVQIVVMGCGGSNPNPPSFTGAPPQTGCGANSGCVDSVYGGIQVGCNRIIACQGTPLVFTVEAHDPDSVLGQTLVLTSNATVALPGATFDTTYVGGNSGHIRGTVSWTPTTPGTYVVLFTVSDQACDIPLFSSFSVYIQVIRDTPVLMDFVWGPPGSGPLGNQPDSVPVLVEAPSCGTLGIVFYTDSNYGDTVRATVVIEGSSTLGANEVLPSADTTFELVLLPGETSDTLWLEALVDGIREPVETLYITTFGRCGRISELAVLVVDSPEVQVHLNDSIFCSPDTVVMAFEGSWLELFDVAWHTLEPPYGGGYLCGDCPDTVKMYVDSSRIFAVHAYSGQCHAMRLFSVWLSRTEVRLPADTVICLYDSAHLTFEPLPGPWAQWEWHTESGICSNCPSVGWEVLNSQEVIVFAEDTFGCLRSDTTWVFVDSTAWVTLTAEDTIILQGTSTLLVGETPASTFWWVPTTGIADTMFLITEASPSVTTTYYLWIRSEEGCLRRDSVTIYVLTPDTCGSSAIFVPTVFTPNGDGKNDVLYVYSRTPLLLEEFVIYDRWGNPVWTARQVPIVLERLRSQQGWDGTLPGGGRARSDVYVWYVRGRCLLPPYGEFTHKGDVTLLR